MVLVGSSPFAESAVLEKGFPGIGLLALVNVVVFVVPQTFWKREEFF